MEKLSNKEIVRLQTLRKLKRNAMCVCDPVNYVRKQVDLVYQIIDWLTADLDALSDKEINKAMSIHLKAKE